MGRTEEAPRLGPSQRLPPSSSPIGRARPIQQTAPSAAQKARDAEKLTTEFHDSNVIRRRQYIVWAVGAAVFTVACTFLGARLKEFKQESDHMKEIETAARELSSRSTVLEELNSQAVPTTAIQQEQDTKQNTTQAVGGRAAAAQSRSSPYSLEVAKQIALLEDRKALLNRQKITLEAKIQTLRERQARKAQMDARRPTQGDG